MIALATSATIGSLSKFSFIEFILYAGPAVAVGLFLNIGLLWLYYGRGLPKTMALDFPVVLPGNRNHLGIVLMGTGGVIIVFCRLPISMVVMPGFRCIRRHKKRRVLPAKLYWCC